MEICLHALGRRKEGDSPDLYVDLFRVNLEANRVTRYGADVVFESDSVASMVALGDVIYLVGSCGPRRLKKKKKNKKRGKLCFDNRHHIHSQVSRINLVDLDGGWKELNHPFKAIDHTRHPCVSFNNKLYLFGGRIRNAADGIVTNCPGEVYDPELDSWDVLPEPEVTELHRVSYYGSHVSYPVIVDTKNNRIIVHLKYANSIYAYHPDQRQWVCLVHPFEMWSGLTVIFDDMLIFHLPDSETAICPFMAFDLVTKKKLTPVFSPGFDNHSLLSAEFDALIPMAPPGTFCFGAWSPSLDDAITNVTYLIFLKFSVERNHCGNPVFNFFPSQKLCVDGTYGIINFIPIAPKGTHTEEEAGLT